MSIDAVTPQQLIYLYSLLSDDGKAVFRDLLGRRLTADQFFLVMDALPMVVKAEVMSMCNRQFTTVAVPSLVLEAIRIARQYPETKEPELAKMVEEQVTNFYSTAKTMVEAQVKEARDRKSDPETVKRNVEICDKRNLDKKKWTLGQLAKDYDMSRQSIVSILKNEEKWRRLAAQV